MKNSFFALAISGLLVSACGREASAPTESGSGSNPDAVTLKSNPLAGTNAASLPMRMFESVFGFPEAHAVSSFVTLQLCVGEVVFEAYSGGAKTGAKPLKPGLLTFSASSSEPMTIGTLDLQAATVLKNIKFTIEKVPSLCGVEYAVLFNSGSGEKRIEQNTSFKFEFGSSGRSVSAGDSVTLYLGQIVDSMVAKGDSLSSETIQTVDAGQAK